MVNIACPEKKTHQGTLRFKQQQLHIQITTSYFHFGLKIHHHTLRSGVSSHLSKLDVKSVQNLNDINLVCQLSQQRVGTRNSIYKILSRIWTDGLAQQQHNQVNWRVCDCGARNLQSALWYCSPVDILVVCCAAAATDFSLAHCSLNREGKRFLYADYPTTTPQHYLP